MTIGDTEVPTTFDWREKNNVTAVRDQGSCESCWAMAAVQLIESRFAFDFHKLEAFSP